MIYKHLEMFILPNMKKKKPVEAMKYYFTLTK